MSDASVNQPVNKTTQPYRVAVCYWHSDMTSFQLQKLCESLASSSHRTCGWISTSLLSVSSVCSTAASSSSSFAWRRLSSNRVHAFVTSRVDYCNCLLAGATKASINKLQRRRELYLTLPSSTVGWQTFVPFRRDDLHWLDVPERVTFRLCIMVYKCLHDMAPPYPVWTVPADLQHRRTPSTALSDSRRPRCSKMSTINIRQTALGRQHGTLYWIVYKQYINYCTI